MSAAAAFEAASGIDEELERTKPCAKVVASSDQDSCHEGPCHDRRTQWSRRPCVERQIKCNELAGVIRMGLNVGVSEVNLMRAGPKREETDHGGDHCARGSVD